MNSRRCPCSTAHIRTAQPLRIFFVLVDQTSNSRPICKIDRGCTRGPRQPSGTLSLGLAPVLGISEICIVQVYFAIVRVKHETARNRGSSTHYEIGYDLLYIDQQGLLYSAVVTHASVVTDRAPRQARGHLLKELNEAKTPKSHFDLD
jgi:hypothetical protein